MFCQCCGLIGHDNEPTPEMKAYIASEGLDFGMASPARYRDAMQQAGFVGIKTSSRNAWYCETARNEIEQLKGPLYEGAVAKLGREFVDHNIAIWANMLPVLQSGEHCPMLAVTNLAVSSPWYPILVRRSRLPAT